MPASRELPVIADGPAIEDVAASVYVIPTDAPEADGTLAWDETTMVLVTATAGEYSWSLADSARLIDAGAVDCLQLDVTRCGGITEFLRGAALAAAHSLQVSAHCAPNLHAHVGAAVVNLRHIEYFHDHQRIEQLLFDGTLDPQGGALAPGLDQPGLGLQLKTADAERYRRA
jgi:L-alanine-DL-glutamate epimerase-like enolase superfamily enzyme